MTWDEYTAFAVIVVVLAAVMACMGLDGLEVRCG
jgi:preprotein translocase subunit SecE